MHIQSILNGKRSQFSHKPVCRLQVFKIAVLIFMNICDQILILVKIGSIQEGLFLYRNAKIIWILQFCDFVGQKMPFVIDFSEENLGNGIPQDTIKPLTSICIAIKNSYQYYVISGKDNLFRKSLQIHCTFCNEN